MNLTSGAPDAAYHELLLETAPEDVGIKVGGSLCLDGRSRTIKGYYQFVRRERK